MHVLSDHFSKSVIIHVCAGTQGYHLVAKSCSSGNSSVCIVCSSCSWSWSVFNFFLGCCWCQRCRSCLCSVQTCTSPAEVYFCRLCTSRSLSIAYVCLSLQLYMAVSSQRQSKYCLASACKLCDERMRLSRAMSLANDELQMLSLNSRET